MIKSDKTMAIVLFLFSIFMFINSFSIPHQSNGIEAASPSFFPQVWCVILAGLSILLFFQGRKKENGSKKGVLFAFKERRNVYYMLFASLGYIFLIRSLGYILTTFLFLCITITVLGLGQKLSKLRVITISLIITVGTYLIFAKVLKVFLPMGTLF